MMDKGKNIYTLQEQKFRRNEQVVSGKW